MKADPFLYSLSINNKDSNKKCLKNLAYFLEYNHQEPELKIDTFAASVFMSERTLRRKCISLFNCNPSELLLKYRIQVAKLLLLEEKAIGDISSEVGFTTHAHFSTQFKKLVGLSPQEFRDKSKKLSE